MTPEAQRIALAEWEGVRLLHDPQWIRPKRNPDIPDYLNDLNAVHRLEKKAFTTPMERCNYLCHLENVASRTREVAPDKTIDPMTQWACFATAAQRCEALLKTLGLWKE